MTLLLLCALSGATFAADPELVRVGPTAFQPVLPYPADLRAALADREHSKAATLLGAFDASKLPGATVADHQFVTAWTLQRSGRGSEAVKLLETVQKAEAAPATYVDLVVGEILMAAGKPVDAVAPLLRATAVSGAAPAPDDLGASAWRSPIEVRAQLALADAYQKAGRTADARAVWTALAARPDPSPGSSQALWVLAQRSPAGSAEATGYLQRLYRYYPNSAEDKAAAAAGRYGTPTIEDLAIRADRLQEAGSWESAVTLLEAKLPTIGTKDAAGCRARYAYGRAQHKRNNITIAADVLGAVGRSCKGIDDDRAAKALYLAGKSLERKKDPAGAARAYLAIPELYPTHSMADDGYTLGGIQLQEAGDLAGARREWAEGLEKFPKGDLAGETAWRLAWGAYLAGDTAEAIRWAERGVEEVPISSSPTDVIACHYWAARWRGWPDKANPRAPTKDAEALAKAADGLEKVATEHAWHYYAVLAAARLAKLDPARAAKLGRPERDAYDAPWQVRKTFLDHPAVRNAMGLVRVGLYADAQTELAALPEDELLGSEMAILTQVQTDGGDFLLAHDRMRAWLKTHPPETLAPNRWKVMAHAYPERWWPEVQKAATYDWDPRVFHALVREESNFNPEIKSHAGACGLSQLMPTTASGCAKRMGIPWASSKIWDPETNLKIGAWYLDTLHDRYKGNSAVALAGYNAGEGNADRWLAASPNAPTDAWVETITFRETRFYVKRVLSTWQTYRLLYGEGPLFADWSAFVDDAVP